MKKYIKSGYYFEGVGRTVVGWHFWGSNDDECRQVLIKILDLISNADYVYLEWGSAYDVTGVDFRQRIRQGAHIDYIYKYGFDAYPVSTDAVIPCLQKLIDAEYPSRYFLGIKLSLVSNKHYLLEVDNGSLVGKRHGTGTDHLWD